MFLRILAPLLIALVIAPGTALSAPSDSLALTEADASSDSTLIFRYGALYESRVDLERSSGAFPWNDPENESHLSDRLSLMASVGFRRGFAIFVKGATGYRDDGRPFYNERFALEQGHFSFRHEAAGIDGRLFLRERVYRSGFLLLPLVTPDRSFTSVRGEGLLLEFVRWDLFRARYIESALREDPRIDDFGGLPLFSGGADVFRHVEAGIRDFHGLRLDEIRDGLWESDDFDDAENRIVFTVDVAMGSVDIYAKR